MTAIPSRTVRFREYGEQADVLRDEVTEIADPAPGLIRVRVAAVGLNPADWEVCRGFQAGALPRPDQVAPVLGSMYLGATPAPLRFFVLVARPRSSAVKPYSWTICRTC